MATMGDLLNKMNYSSTRFEHVRELFRTFALGINQLSEAAESPVKGIQFSGDLTASDQFELRFLGVTWRFILSAEMPEKGHATGVVTMYKVPLEGSLEPIKNMGRFTFQRDGTSDVAEDQDGLNANVGDSYDALFIALTLIDQAS